MPAMRDPCGFYALLGVTQDADEGAVRKAYYRLALKHHPDRCPSDASEDARREHTAAFQRVGRAYEVLGNAEHRRQYDATGKDPLADGGKSAAYYADMFTRVTTDDIETFKATYVGSAEERAHFLTAMRACNGDPIAAMESVFFASVSDEDRFIAMAREAFDSGELSALSGFAKVVGDEAAFLRGQKRRRAAAAREAKQAERLAQEIAARQAESGRGSSKTNATAKSGEEGLYALIQKRQAGRLDDLVASLEEKYVAKKPSRRKEK